MQRKIGWWTVTSAHSSTPSQETGWCGSLNNARGQAGYQADHQVVEAGVMEDGEWRDDLRRLKAGDFPGLGERLPAFLDLWFQKKWRNHPLATQSSCGTPMISWWVFFRRDAERFLEAVKGRLGALNWKCTRKRLGSSSSDGMPEKTAGGQGRANRRRSTFWASRTAARRLGMGASGWGATRLPVLTRRMTRTLKRIKFFAGCITMWRMWRNGWAGWRTTLPFRTAPDTCAASYASSGHHILRRRSHLLKDGKWKSVQRIASIPPEGSLVP